MVMPKNWKVTWIPEPRQLNAKLMFHASLVDMHLTNDHSIAQGLECVRSIRKQNHNIPILAYSGDLDLKLMEDCLAAGADRFLAKPIVPNELIREIEKIEALWQIRKLESSGTNSTAVWIGSSEASEKVRKTLASFVNEEGPILIEGETGSGKEVSFRVLNQTNRNRPSVAVNVAGISDQLFESEMFGHVRGAFTGADFLKIGLCEAAHGGDLFLDEIEALPLHHQVKLLRFLEDGEFRKVGSKETQYSKVRVIAASNKNLKTLVSEGRFREDLFFRISGKKLQLPPLRNRTEDIPALIDYFLANAKPASRKKISPEAIQVMSQYPWPGNVRELRRVTEQLAAMTPLPIIRDQDVKLLVGGHAKGPADFHIDLRKGLNTLMQEFEIQVLRQALTQYRDVDSAAQILGISRSNFYKKIKDHNIEES